MTILPLSAVGDPRFATPYSPYNAIYYQPSLTEASIYIFPITY